MHCNISYLRNSFLFATTITNAPAHVYVYVQCQCVMSGEVMQTLDVAGDSYGEDTEDEVDSGPPPWGWLFPQTKGFVSQGEEHST